MVRKTVGFVKDLVGDIGVFGIAMITLVLALSAIAAIDPMITGL